MPKQQELKKYFKTIAKNIPSDFEGRASILSSLQQNVISYTNDYPNYTMADVYMHFGEPLDVVASILGDSAVQISIKARTKFKKGILIILVLVIISTITFYALIIHSARNSEAAYYVETITED